MTTRGHHGLLLGAGGGGGGWSPGDLTTPPAHWLRDDSAITEVSGRVSQWNDISSNNWHMTQETAGKRPLAVSGALNGRRVMRFEGDDILRRDNADIRALFSNAASGWLFGVYYLDETAVLAAQRAFYWYSRNGSTTSRVTIGAADASSATPNAPYAAGRPYDANPVGVAHSAAARAQQWCMVLGVIEWASNRITLYVNGELDSVNNAAWASGSNTPSSLSNSVVVGGIDSEAAYFLGDIAEVFAVLDAAPSSDDVDKIFGYAAHRWGLTSVLPGGHPYKTTPP